MKNEIVKFNESMQMITADPAAIAAAETAKQKIQAAYVMAFHKPRSADNARVKILENCKRPAFAEKVEYSKPVGKTKIIGPSIRFTETALREWGNVLTDSQVVYDDDKTRRVKVTVTDLETNTSFTKEIQLSKTVERKSRVDREVIGERKNSYNENVYIVKATDDELANKEAALISKAIRNEGLRIIPSDIIEEAMQTARETLNNRDAKDPDAAKKRVIDGFAKFGVMPKDLENYLGHPLAQLVPAEIQDLRAVYESISSGESKWSDFIKSEEKKEADGKSLLEKKPVEIKKENNLPPSSSGTQMPPKAEPSSIKSLFEGKPVTFDQVEGFFKRTSKLGMTTSLEKNETLCGYVRANLDKVISDTMDYMAKEGGK